ncbi:MAG: hypothetical protein IT282_18110 [Bacteroidetes bacterium]|nr:hypothetical protein [Bacteroidota bacterium]
MPDSCGRIVMSHGVLTDIVMPILDGAAAIRVLRSIDADVRVIATSGVASERSSGPLQELRVEAFLPKPYTAERLLATLGEVLG